jgi:xylulose-5-phosphate/fructose-6-phosphate phosphoketolase
MMIANNVDRFAIAIDAIKGGAKVNQIVSVYAHEKCSLLKHLRQKEKDYIYSFGKGEIESLVSNYG